MFNELILFIHIVVIVSISFVALRLGESALVGLSAMLMVFANIFVLKQITLFGLQATSADAFGIGSLLCLNLLTELYGKAIAKKTIIITFLFSFFYAIVSRIHLLYIPSEIDVSQIHFEQLFVVAPWLVGGSIFIFGCAQSCDYLLYGTLKRWWIDRFLTLRNFIAVSVTQVFDTIAFTFFLYWLGIIQSPMQVTIVSFGIKMVIIAISTPLMTFFLSLHKRLGHSQLH